MLCWYSDAPVGAREAAMDILKCVGCRIVFQISEGADAQLDGPAIYRATLKRVVQKGGDFILVLDDIVYHHRAGPCPYLGPLRLLMSKVSWWKEWP